MNNDLNSSFGEDIFGENISSEYIEIKEKTLDDAITSACRKLMVTSDRLDYVVVDQGSTGFLGFNARPAVIKARVRQSTAKTEEVLSEVLERAGSKAGAAAAEIKEKAADAAEEAAGKAKEAVNAAAGTIAGAAAAAAQALADAAQEVKEAAEEIAADADADIAAEAAEDSAEAAEEAPAKAKSSEPRRKKEERPLTEEEVKIAADKADEFLTQVFGAMGMDVEIESSYDRADNILTLDLAGDDMGILIGKRGQTLDSLQYLVSLVVNKESASYVHVKCDTENYRERRKRTLENLAKNMAFKVKRTKQNVVLEPMNPYERRIIHSALQGDKFVTTYSEGEEPYRKVVVALKK